MAKDWKPWIGDVATQAIGQALGTLLAAGVFVLAGAAFGLIHGLGTPAVATILFAVVTAAASLGGLVVEHREAREAREAREKLLANVLEEASHAYMEDLGRRAQERAKETEDLLRKRDEEERPSSD